MSNYSMKILAATDTEAEAYEVTFKTNYRNTMAQAASISANMASEQRNCLDACSITGTAQDAVLSGPSADYIVEAWNELDDDDNTEAKTRLKASLARECRKMYGFGCKIKDSQLIGTKVGAGKKAKGESVLVTMIKSFELVANEVQNVEMQTILASAMKMYKDAEGKALKV